MTAKKKAPDWPAVRADYLRSEESLRDIAEWHGISDTAIRKRAKAENWPPRAKQVRKVVKCEPPVRTTPMPRPSTPEAAEKAADPGEIANAGRGLLRRLLDELDTVTANVGELEDMIVGETVGDANPKRRDAMFKAVSLGGRASTLKELATAFKTLNEASAPQGKKAAAQGKADAIAGRFRPIGPPQLKPVVN